MYEPLLSEPYVLDLDNTVKSLYGHQEGAELGYNLAWPNLIGIWRPLLPAPCCFRRSADS